MVVGKLKKRLNDEDPALAIQFGVSSIPTLIVMENGEKKAQMIGYRPKADIEKLIEEA